MPETNPLTCPKCEGTMRRYERSGVVIDQCGDCRGVFLDSGELEAIMRAEQAYYGTVAPQPGYSQQPGYPPAPQQGYPQQSQQGFLGGMFGGHHGRRSHH